MEYPKRLRILDDFIDRCNEFIEDINSNSMWEENYAIDNTEAKWRIFKDDVNAYLEINREEERKKQFQVLTTGIRIKKSVFLDLIVFLNNLKNGVKIEMETVSTEVVNIDKVFLPIEDLPKHSDLDNASGEACMLNDKIFIVHGRNEELRDKIELLVRRAGLVPIVLAEQDNCGMTIIEKIEKYSDVAFAIVLYTGCDKGKFKEDSQLHLRARQNVVFEHGYMVAKLGRNKVVALIEPKVEQPGDLSGIVYISMEENNWKNRMFKELEAGGLYIDWTKI